MNQYTQRDPFLLYGPQGNAILPRDLTESMLLSYGKDSEQGNSEEPAETAWVWSCGGLWNPWGCLRPGSAKTPLYPYCLSPGSWWSVISRRDKTGLRLWTCLNHWQPTRPFFIWKNSPQDSPKECLGTWLREQWREMEAWAWALGPCHPHSFVLLFLAKRLICFGSDSLCGKRCKWGLEIKRK